MKKPKQKQKPFKHLSKYLKEKRYLLPTLLLLGVMIITNATSLITPKTLSTIIDEYIELSVIQEKYIYIFTAIILIGTTTKLLQTYLTTLVGEKIGQDLRNRLTEKILGKEYGYILKTKPSKLLTVVMSDVNYIKGTFIQIVITLLVSIFIIVGSAYLMFSINAMIATYIVLIIPTLILILMLSIKKKFGIFKQMQKVRDRLNKVISENIKGSMLIRVFVSEKEEQRKFNKINKRSQSLGIKMSNIFAIVIPTINAIYQLTLLLIVYLGGQEVMSGSLSLGDLSALISYTLLFTTPLLMIGMMLSALGQAMASLKRINAVLDSPNMFVDGEKEIGEIKRIEAKDLDVEIGGKSILKNINFEINKGEKIGIIGLTGSGKSIFLKTLTRSLKPKGGEILVNNLKIQDYKIKDLRHLIGISFQENFLVKGSILENITFGRDISKEQALKVAKVADVEEFANEFKDKYNHEVGERGNKLSGGQKQRIMIARALANNPDLLILDDATSRLDISTEVKVFENIKREFKDISIILVAQKISSIQDCNRIYIFEDGQIEDSGTHETLKETSLLYKEIELTQQNYDS